MNTDGRTDIRVRRRIICGGSSGPERNGQLAGRRDRSDAKAFGGPGAWIIAGLVAISALTSANATIFTGARANYALGRDTAGFGWLGRWDARANAPVPQLLNMPAGTRIVSHNYDLGEWKPRLTREIRTPDGGRHMVYLWRVPEQKPALSD